LPDDQVRRIFGSMFFMEMTGAVLVANMATAYVIYGFVRMYLDERNDGEVTVKTMLIFLSALGVVLLLLLASQG